MNTGLISIRYAKALLYTGLEKEDLPEILYENCTGFCQILKESSDFDTFIKSPVIKGTQKKQFIRKAFSGKFHDIMLNFIEIIIDNKREKLMNDIFRDFLDIYRKRMGILSVTFVTAVPISDNGKKEIFNMLEDYMASEIELETKVDPDIIGGMIIVADDKQADGSILGELRALKKKMMN